MGRIAAPTVQDLAMLGEVEKASAEQLNEFKRYGWCSFEAESAIAGGGSAEISQSYVAEPGAAHGAERSEE